MIPDCPGYLVERRLTDGGRLWAARDVRSGARVTLLLAPAGARPADVGHAHVAPVREVVDGEGGVGSSVVVLDVGDARTLDSLLDAPLPPGAVVTALRPVVDALDALHAAGLVHGAVDGTSVLLDRAGRPWLVAPGEAATGSSATPAGDVRALAVLARRALAGSGRDAGQAAPAPAGVDVDAWARLAAAAGADLPAADLAAALTLLGPAAPIRPGRPAGVVDRPHPGSPRRPRRVGRRAPRVDRRARRLLAVLAAVAGLAGTLLVGARLATGDVTAPADSPGAARLDLTEPAVVCAPAADPSSATPAGPTPARAHTTARAPGRAPATSGGGAATPAGAEPDAPADWAVAVRELYARRVRALQNGDPAALCAVYARSSPGLAADLELLAAYAAAGVRPSALQFDVLRVGAGTRSATGVEVAITDRLAAYQLVAADGTVRSRRPALPKRTWRARLQAGPDGHWVFG